MAETTKIQWAHATFNPWRGCQKVSPGCQNCYAETQARRNPRVLGEWGPEGERVIASETYWKLPLKWDREAQAAGERRRVFCASLADFAEVRPELVAPRQRLFELIGVTEHLDWLLLTKRPEVALENWPLWAGMAMGARLKAGLLNKAFGLVIPNVWLGVSVEDQARKGRIDILRQIPAAVRFLSLEPLLEDLGELDLSGIHWVIIGGESGPKARPNRLEWDRSLIAQCRGAGVSCFEKQLGARPEEERPLRLRDPKGGDPAEWPADLRVREFPTPRADQAS